MVCKLRNNKNAFVDALTAINKFVTNLGVQEIRIVMQIPQGKLEGKRVGRIYARGKEIFKELRKNSCKEKSLPVIVDFCEFEGKEYMGCMAGINYITINNDGLVTPCVAVPLSFGNINNSSLEDIYRHAKIFSRFRLCMLWNCIRYSYEKGFYYCSIESYKKV